MIYRVVLNESIDLFGTELYYDKNGTGEQHTDIILNPSLEIELNSAGTLTFTMPPEHESWALPSIFTDEIEVFEGDDIIWFGRPLEISRDWKNQKQVKCEGALAYFNDSIQRPVEYPINKWWLYEDPDTPSSVGKGFLNTVIDIHNNQVPTNRQIQVGRVTVENVPVYRETNYDRTSEVLQQMCLDTSGGFFMMRKEDGVRYLDWLDTLPEDLGQRVQFGLNLLDMKQDLNGSDICTVLIPVGEDDKLVNNVQVYDDEHPYSGDTPGYTFQHVSGSDEIIFKEGLEMYGRVLEYKSFDGVYTKNDLFKEGCDWLRRKNTDIPTIECSAADLHYLDEYKEEYDKFELGTSVLVSSEPHGINKVLSIYKISLNLASGIKNMTIGTPPKRELTDIIQTKTGSTRSSTSSSSGGSGGGGGSSTVLVKDVKVKYPGEEKYKSVVTNKVAKIDISDVSGSGVQDVLVNGASVVDENEVANINIEIPVTDVQIDDVSIVDENGIANIDSSQFGTTVVANPSDTPTDDLTSIKIGSTVYDIPGGGGGGGKQYTCDLLFENDPMPSPTSGTSNVTRTYTLDKSIDDYDAVHIICYGYHTSSGNTNIFPTLVFKKDYYIVGFDDNGYYQDSNTGPAYRMIMYKFTDSTHVSTFAMRSESDNEPILYKIYGLKFAASVINNPVSLSDYYDTAERVVGRWTDGKPLYQKTIHVNGPLNSGNNSINHDISNLGEVVLTEGTCKCNNTNEVLHLPYISLNTNYNIGFSNVDTTRFMIYIGTGFTSVEDINITLQYTKTTDAAGTGPVRGTIIQRSDIYSTEERQVGRWTDGKPLYQKSYQISVDNSSAAPYYCQSYPHGISNIDPNSVTFKASIITNQGVVRPLAFNFGTNDPSAAVLWNGNVFADDTYLDFELGSQLRANSDTIIVTIQYTKTTDIPGTGLLPDEPTHIAVASCYSEDEQVVGRWTDGKPLYQKTLHYTETTEQIQKDYDFSSLNTDRCFILFKQMKLGSVANNIWVSEDQWYDSSYNRWIALDENNKILGVGSRGWKFTEIIVVIQYTKTTDVPNTGPIVGNLRYLPTIYSEQEREIGVWTDGKPLYQKTYKNLGISLTQGVWSSTGIALNTIDHWMVSYDKSTSSNLDHQYPMLFRYENGYLEALCQYTMPLDELTLQYTKTTDTPGSGTWTPEGQLAHHYSTSEHIVGTWIDGSTIYERTWDFGSDINVPTNWIATSIPNTGMNMCIACEAVSNSCIPRANIEAQVNSGSYVNLSADSVANPVRYLTLRYTKT